MKNLLLSGGALGDSYTLLIVLVVIIVGFLFLSFSRRKKEQNYREELTSKIVPGALVKTYSGLYGKVISITDTTDGKIILLESGEGKKVSYQNVHINAVFGIDTKKELIFDENGNDITFANATEEEVEYIEVEEDEEVVEVEEEEVVEEVQEPETNEEVVEEIEAAVAGKSKKSTAKKSTSTGKKSTSKKSTAK